MEDAGDSSEAWSSRERSVPRRSSSVASHSIPGRRERKWTPSWLSRSGSTRREAAAGPSRRISTSTTGSSTISTGTCSSLDTEGSQHFNTYQLPTINSDESDERDCGEKATYDSVNDATSALQALSMSIPEDEEFSYQDDRPTSRYRDKDLPPLPRRTESRAMSIRSRASRLSTITNDETIGMAEIEMACREYTGYWRASSTAHIPPAAAICGALLITTRLPSRERNDSGLSTDEVAMDRAAALCETLDEAQSPEEALSALQNNSLQTAVLAVHQSLESAKTFAVPDKIAWQMYQKIAEARNHPDKISGLWQHLSKLLKKIPPNVLVVIVFLLSIARRLQSRRILINGGSPAVFLLQSVFPRYVEEDVSRILLKNFDNLPEDLPQVLEGVNFRFAGRKCNILTLVASKRKSVEVRNVGRGGVQEIRTSEERDMQW